MRVVVPVAPGGANDVTARLIGQWLSERLGQQFVIENRPGAGTNIGTEAVIRAPADGYTLLIAGSNAAINATLFRSLNFNFIRDTAPIGSIVRVPQLMQVNPSLPARSVPEFIAYAKANPGKIAMGSGGIGSPAHVVGEYFKLMTGTDLTHVPYRGAAPAVTDLIAGQIQVAFTEMATSLGHVKAGKPARIGGDDRRTLGGAAGRSDARASSFPVSRRASGSGSLRRRTRRPRSSRNSTPRSTLRLAIPR